MTVTEGEAANYGMSDSLPLAKSAAEWEQRFKDYFAKHLIVAGWSKQSVKDAAEGEFEAVELDLTEVPEYSAEECMSYWDNDE